MPTRPPRWQRASTRGERAAQDALAACHHARHGGSTNPSSRAAQQRKRPPPPRSPPCSTPTRSRATRRRRSNLPEDDKGQPAVQVIAAGAGGTALVSGGVVQGSCLQGQGHHRLSQQPEHPIPVQPSAASPHRRQTRAARPRNCLPLTSAPPWSRRTQAGALTSAGGFVGSAGLLVGVLAASAMCFLNFRRALDVQYDDGEGGMSA